MAGVNSDFVEKEVEEAGKILGCSSSCSESYTFSTASDGSIEWREVESSTLVPSLAVGRTAEDTENWTMSSSSGKP